MAWISSLNIRERALAREKRQVGCSPEFFLDRGILGGKGREISADYLGSPALGPAETKSAVTIP